MKSDQKKIVQFGVDRVLHEPAWIEQLEGKRIALLGHPASMSFFSTQGLREDANSVQEKIRSEVASNHSAQQDSRSHYFLHSLDVLARHPRLRVTAAMGPQHGMRGDQQDNMMESKDFIDPWLKIPVYSLYGEVRRPTAEMMKSFDVLLFDVQDLGCRIYTFLTTLLYCLEACASHGKEIWVLDRPNPAGRGVEGMALQSGWESFVGAAPGIPMRHGLTLGEAALWMKSTLGIAVNLRVVPMLHYSLQEAPGWGWPVLERPWVNPSPNAASLNMARCYPGTVLLEGTTLSEGRGTTRPLEIVGAPDLPVEKILNQMAKLAPEWMQGAWIRPCFFEPTFHKHQKKLNRGVQLHAEGYGLSQQPHGLGFQPDQFRPYRWMALFFKALRQVDPSYPLWRDFPYEYEMDRLAIDVINGGPGLREWVDTEQISVREFDLRCREDEVRWEKQRQPFLLYDRDGDGSA